MTARHSILWLMLCLIALPCTAAEPDPGPPGTVLTLAPPRFDEGGWRAQRQTQPPVVKPIASVPILQRPPVRDARPYWPGEPKAQDLPQSVELAGQLAERPAFRRYAQGLNLACGETAAAPHRLLCWKITPPPNACGIDSCARGSGMGRPVEPVAVPLPGPVDGMALGDSHGCVVSAGKVLCFGYNGCGAAGAALRDTDHRPGLVPVVSRHGCFSQALRPGRTDNALWVPFDHPVEMALPPATAVAADDNASCAIAGGRLYCWGYLYYISSDMYSRSGPKHPWPDLVQPQMTGAAILPDLACRIEDASSLFCGGSSTPMRLGNIDGLIAARMNSGWICVLRADGTVSCLPVLRDHPPGAAGLDRYDSAQVAGLSDAVEIALADQIGCALTRAGALRCWGGTGITPVPKPRSRLHVAGFHAEARSVFDWRAITVENSPLLLAGAAPFRFEKGSPLPPFVSLRAGSWGRICAMTADRQLYCAGDTNWLDGQSPDAFREIPLQRPFTGIGPLPAFIDWDLSPEGGAWLLRPPP